MFELIADGLPEASPSCLDGMSNLEYSMHYTGHSEIPYIALLQRLHDQPLAAAETLRPWMTRSAEMVLSSDRTTSVVDQRALSEALFALCRADPAQHLPQCTWRCRHCQSSDKPSRGSPVIEKGEKAVLCECCLFMYCEAFMEVLGTESATRFCVEGHKGTEVVLEGGLVFRGREMEMADCIVVLREEWGLE